MLFWFAVYMSLSLDPKNIYFIISGNEWKYELHYHGYHAPLGKGGLGLI